MAVVGLIGSSVIGQERLRWTASAISAAETKVGNGIEDVAEAEIKSDEIATGGGDTSLGI